MSDLLKSVVQNLINDNHVDAADALHQYVVQKTQSVIGLKESDDDPQSGKYDEADKLKFTDEQHVLWYYSSPKFVEAALEYYESGPGKSMNGLFPSMRDVMKKLSSSTDREYTKARDKLISDVKKKFTPKELSSQINTPGHGDNLKRLLDKSKRK